MDRKWHFTTEEGNKEEVALERWVWAVLYKDGTELHQFDDNGVFHQFKEIDVENVRLWVLYQPLGNGRIDFVVPEGKEVSLIHKYRNFIFAAGSPNETRQRAYMFGYKVKGGQPHYNFVMPDDRIVQSYGEDQPKLTEMGIGN